MSEQVVGAATGVAGGVCGCAPQPESACVPHLSAPADRLAALRAAVAAEAEPLITLTHLLRLCRDEHPVLWARVNDPPCRARVACVVAEVEAALPTPGTAAVLDARARQTLAAALEPREDTHRC